MQHRLIFNRKSQNILIKFSANLNLNYYKAVDHRFYPKIYYNASVYQVLLSIIAALHQPVSFNQI